MGVTQPSLSSPRAPRFLFIYEINEKKIRGAWAGTCPRLGARLPPPPGGRGTRRVKNTEGLFIVRKRYQVEKVENYEK